MTKGEDFAHAFVSRAPVEVIFLSSKTSNNAFVFPLWIYSAADSGAQVALDDPTPAVNLSPSFLAEIASHVRLEEEDRSTPDGVAPENVLAYAYAVLHSPSYRDRFSEFLKVDFPRLPLPGSRQLFDALAAIGGELIELHLLESPRLADAVCAYIGPDAPEVGRVDWSEETVWLDASAVAGDAPVNGTVGFRGVSSDAWNFHIGGYQLCRKWLRDRKNRRLSSDEVAHYVRMVTAVTMSLRLMEDVDDVIEENGGWPEAFASAHAAPARVAG